MSIDIIINYPMQSTVDVKVRPLHRRHLVIYWKKTNYKTGITNQEVYLVVFV